jgi:hypothetical protein
LATSLYRPGKIFPGSTTGPSKSMRMVD